MNVDAGASSEQCDHYRTLSRENSELTFVRWQTEKEEEKNTSGGEIETK